MSRHVPLLCRDPFFRDIERDFWGDRPRTAAPAPSAWVEGAAPTKLFDQASNIIVIFNISSLFYVY